MSKKSVIITSFFLLAFAAILMSFQVSHFGGLTGFVVLNQNTQNNFSSGTYVNTTHNGTSIVLNGNNMTGTYTSEIFDAGSVANWNNLSSSNQSVSVESLFTVAGSGIVYKSTNLGLNWAQVSADYGGGATIGHMFSDSKYLYIVFGGASRDLWRSADLGTSWSIVNNTFANNNLLLGVSDSDDNLYVVDNSGDIYKSSDYGVSWPTSSDFDPSTIVDAYGIVVDSNNNLYVVNGNRDVFKSPSGGSSWTQINESFMIANTPDDMAIDEQDKIYIFYNSEVYKSQDSGVNWNLVNSTYPTQATLKVTRDSAGNLYVFDTSGDVFKSSDEGLTWQTIADFNGATSATPKGVTSFVSDSSLVFKVRNCSSSDCSGESFVSANLNNLNLQGRYFQYQVIFSRTGIDSNPLLNSVSLDYGLASSTPLVNVAYPQNGQTFSTNVSLPLNFSVTNTISPISSCWYTLNNGFTNVSLTACGNTTFNVSGNGNYLIKVYANESVAGITSFNSSNFSVAIAAPNVTLISPLNGSYVNSSNVLFVYNASSTAGIGTCNLFGNFNGTYMLNKSSSSVVSGRYNNFSLSLSERSYLWAIKCNNSQGISSISQNNSFNLDFSAPDSTIYEPNGTYDELSIPINTTVIDTSPITLCSYNLNFSVGGSSISITISSNCSASSFNVDSSANYSFSVISGDSAGNVGTETTNFYVTPTASSGGGSSGGGSGGGGGGGGGVLGLPKLNVSYNSALGIARGSDGSFDVEAYNIGTRFLNACSASVTGDAASWFSNGQKESIASGQKVNYLLNVEIPQEVSPGSYMAKVVVKCNEITISKDLVVNVVSHNVDLSILNTERKDLSTLELIYSLEDFTGQDQDVSLNYKIVNSEGVEISEGSEEVFVSANSKQDYVLEIPLPKDSFGEFDLVISISAGSENYEKTHKLALSSGGLTGFAISSDNRKTLSFALFAVLFGGAIFFVYRFLRKHHNKVQSGDEKGRKLIKLDLGN